MDSDDGMSLLDLDAEQQLRPPRKAIPERGEDARRQITVSGLVRLNLDNAYYEEQLDVVTRTQSTRLADDCAKSWEWAALTCAYRQADMEHDSEIVQTAASQFVAYWREIRCNRKLKKKATRLVSHREAEASYWTEEKIMDLLVVHSEVVALRQQVIELPEVPRDDAKAFVIPIEVQIKRVFRADGLRLISRELWKRLEGVSKDACAKPEMAYDESAVQCAFLLLRANCEDNVGECVPDAFRIRPGNNGAYVPVAAIFLTSVTAYMIMEIWKLLSWRAYGSYQFDAEKKATLSVLNKSYAQKEKRKRVD